MTAPPKNEAKASLQSNALLWPSAVEKNTPPLLHYFKQHSGPKGNVIDRETACDWAKSQSDLETDTVRPFATRNAQDGSTIMVEISALSLKTGSKY